VALDEHADWSWVEYISFTILGLSVLGFLQIVSPTLHSGGVIGYGVGTLATNLFAVYAGAVILAAIAIISVLVLLNEELGVPEFLKKLFSKKEEAAEMGSTIMFTPEELADEDEKIEEPTKPKMDQPIRVPKVEPVAIENQPRKKMMMRILFLHPRHFLKRTNIRPCHYYQEAQANHPSEISRQTQT